MSLKTPVSQSTQRHAVVLWLTGPSAAGKSTIADSVYARLKADGASVERLDGDIVRRILPETGFDRASREAHIRRIGHLASILERNGVTVVASFISPDRDAREFIRSLCTRFVEIHVSTPIEECIRRDPKGLYQRARRGELTNMVGLDTPYEAPVNAEVTIDTTELSVEESTQKVLAVHAEVCARELTPAR